DYIARDLLILVDAAEHESEQARKIISEERPKCRLIAQQQSLRKLSILLMHGAIVPQPSLESSGASHCCWCRSLRELNGNHKRRGLGQTPLPIAPVIAVKVGGAEWGWRVFAGARRLHRRHQPP